MALYAANDEAPRFVIAPDSVEDCFHQMVNAFNLAEKYQMLRRHQGTCPKHQEITLRN